MKYESRERGTTLLFALGILTLLAVFGVTFVAVTKTERSASANYTQAVRARLLARAGVERALAELQRLAKHRHYSHPVADGWAYSDSLPADDPGAIPVGDRNDLLYTLNPSFPTTEAGIPFFGSPNLVHSAELSGMGRSVNNGIDCYKLKILDEPSMLNLNHPDPAAIKRMLKNLLQAAGLAVGTATNVAVNTINNRPGGGFTSKSEVRAALESAGLPPVTNLTAPVNWFTIRDMVTCYGWTDEKVIRPWALNTSPSDHYDAADLEPNARHSLDLMARAPINLNTASFPVLVALFADARAVSQRFGSFRIGYPGASALANAIIAHRTSAAGPFKTWREFEDFVDGIGPAACANTVFSAANHTVNLAPSAANTGAPTEVNPGADLPAHRWMSEIPVDGSSLVTRALNPATRNQGIRDLVKAVANPNTMLSKFGSPPNQGSTVILPGITTKMPRFVDKADITALTTEGCFDAMGMYEITSLGLVLQRVENDAGGFDTIVIAAQTEKQVAQVYSVFRLTSQQDFERHRAAMISGNFMPAQDLNWSYSIKGANKLAYGPFTHATNPALNRAEGFQGWPGILTGPNYSLERLGTNTLWQIADEYVPATYDGNLTLNNLLALKTEPPDFMIGFSRGQLKAFKVRAWWEPRDQQTNGSPIDLNRPTHPSDDFQATGADPQSGGELDRLASPLNNVDHQPRTHGVNAFDERSAVDELAPGNPELTAPRYMFLEGSSMWNNGVAIHGRRKDEGSGIAQFLAYDSANLDLNTGSSVRFWVQPLVDPFLREEEVLLSFVGDDGQHTGIDSSGNPAYTDRNAGLNGADARRFGFRVIKKYDPILGDIFIRLETIGGWAVSGGGAPNNRVQFVVTPTSGGVNPLQPEWLPGSWHWVVVNFGAQVPGLAPTRVSLQVDMVLSDPANSLRLRGDGQGGLIEYGELQGHDWGWGGPFARGPLRPGASNASIFWTETRFLGDWFHCDVGLSTTTNHGSDGPRGPQAIVYDGSNYVQGPDWWPTDPFPPGAFNREIKLSFSYLGTATPAPSPPPPLDMTSAGSPPSWSASLDSTHYGPDGVEGGEEWGIYAQADWDTSTITGTKCNCCEPAADGGVGAAHDSMATGKGGRPTPLGAGGKYSFVQWWGPGKMAPSLSGVPDTGNTDTGFGLHAEGDDCHGCEACDVDGPIFFGGEPGPPVFNSNITTTTNKGAMNGNYGGAGGDAAPNGVNPSTMAYAVFDNIAFVNGTVRRTDNLGDPNVHFFEDRYFETTLAFHANALLSESNYGAFYHRGLLELIGQTGELGTLTWTAYPSMEGLEFSVGLWELQDFVTGLGATPPNSIWNATNTNILDNAIGGGPGAPTYGGATVGGYTNAFTTNPVSGAAHTLAAPPPGGNGLSFVTVPRYDGIGDTVTEPHMLILGIQLEGVPTGGPTAGTAAAGAGGSTVANTVRTGTTGVRGGVPQPLLSTPVFEDVTLTMVLLRPKIVFAEEGTEE
ncbi:MAG: hypothetical protein KDD82_07855 [Planctomycetes bacterium]|nr:hypothetical protein [Planctomycetota bacterium]